MSRERVVYVSYDGLTDPLGGSQIAPYLQALAARGFRIHCFSFEKSPSRAACIDIGGFERTYIQYRRGIVALASVLWAFLLVAKEMVLRRPRVAHARSYVSATILLPLCLAFRVPLIFDMRGLWVDERVDAGLWKPNGFRQRIGKRIERSLLRRSAAVVTLTRASIPTLEERCPGIASRLLVVSTAADEHAATPSLDRDSVVYLGSIGTWYDIDGMLRVAKAIIRRQPGLKLRIATPQGDLARESAGRVGVDAEILRLDNKDVPTFLHRAAIGLCLYLPGPSRVACNPTKIGEYLAAGVPVVASAFVGDVRNLESDGVVALVGERFDAEEISERAVIIANEPEIAARCRLAASKWYGRKQAVHTYEELYSRLAQVH